MADVPEPGFRKYWREELSSPKSESHATTNKYPEAASIVRVHKMISDIVILAKSTLTGVEKSSQWTTIVNSAEENRAKFCTFLDGKPLFSALYGTYTVPLKKLQAVLKVNAQTGQSGAVNKTSLESRGQDDDFQEVKNARGISLMIRQRLP
jgi:hypothetical protein